MSLFLCKYYLWENVLHNKENTLTKSLSQVRGKNGHIINAMHNVSTHVQILQSSNL